MTVTEVANLLIQDYGVYNALNLDGGGSTSMAIQDPATGLGRFVNASSDNPNGRLEGSNLAVFAVAVPEPFSFGFMAAGLFVLVIWWRAARAVKTPTEPPPASAGSIAA